MMLVSALGNRSGDGDSSKIVSMGGPLAPAKLLRVAAVLVESNTVSLRSSASSSPEMRRLLSFSDPRRVDVWSE